MTRANRPSAVPPEADAVGAYLADLSAALRGPRTARERLVEEMRGDLAETVAVHVGEGMPAEEAGAEAVREFGPVTEIAAACQEELTVAQARHTAKAVALAVPVLLACWSPLWPTGHAVELLAVPSAATAGCAAVLAFLVLATTGPSSPRLPSAALLPRAMAWAGTAAAAAIALGTAALCVSAANGPPLALAVGAALLGHGKVAASARRCRDCARLAPA
ncbi:hypothetical protein EDD29_6655 [Actinocorallia herbida]|uniref:Uncharacterized protein n=1 Tax=Actinocorallia herbida TaxID=58109 RepID=A0A3N1D786_9ACTN|nr:permease prefix domain 1-containing protein [Actinocorallia herbida]ROO88968.1 hypothetical protein EDD29_6655 [Actinocorallia herbida]